MSVSDVVEIKDPCADTVEPGFYFCDSLGFKKIEFDPDKAGPHEEYAGLEMEMS